VDRGISGLIIGRKGGRHYNAVMCSARAETEVWTTRRLLNWTAEYLQRRGVESGRLAAEMLLAHVLEVGRIKLYTDLERPASPLERAAYRELVERAAGHEPVQYLVGQAHFFSMIFEVNAHVLIPRPSTEALVEHVIQHVRRTPGFVNPRIADVGTGSGCIGIALAKHLPGSQVVATDVDAAALDVARDNARKHDVADRVEFRVGSHYEPLGGKFAFICTNPPYIPDGEWEAVASNVKDHEPAHALRGGADGLDYIRPLIASAAEHLEDPGQLVLEFAASCKQAVMELAARAPGLANAHILADAEGHPRILVADRA
jgi:release factor glutamine methyltransferase